MRSKRHRRIRRKRKGYTRRKMKGGAVRPIPIFIISYNQYTYLKSMVEQLQRFPGLTIYVIDNKSTYPPLVEYLKSIEGSVKVLYQDKNYGHEVYERDDIIALGGDKYIVTDPDLVLNPKMPLNFLEILSELSDRYRTNKIGPALDITNGIDLSRRLDSNDGKTISEHESIFWKDRVDDPTYEMYRADIDTTFALINKKYYVKQKRDNSIRIAGDFTAVHRTWLKDYEKELLPGELDYYMKNGNISTTINRWVANS